MLVWHNAETVYVQLTRGDTWVWRCERSFIPHRVRRRLFRSLLGVVLQRDPVQDQEGGKEVECRQSQGHMHTMPKVQRLRSVLGVLGAISGRAGPLLQAREEVKRRRRDDQLGAYSGHVSVS